MKMIIVGGPPSSGKTRVIVSLLKSQEHMSSTGVVKVDCSATQDDTFFAEHSIPSIKFISNDICPDHFLAENIPEVRTWAAGHALDTVVIETAGLCGRCSPYLFSTVNICVIDCTCGMHGPSRLGPVLKSADCCVITKGDLISPAEREVFTVRVLSEHPAATIVWFNGITGEGTQVLARTVRSIMSRKKRSGAAVRLRTPLPQMYCTYCFGNVIVDMAFSQQGPYGIH